MAQYSNQLWPDHQEILGHFHQTSEWPEGIQCFSIDESDLKEQLCAYLLREQDPVGAAKDMVYDWDGKEGRCYELYIEQGKSLEEVMQWFRENQEFGPSKRAFQTQIKRWNFPPKHNLVGNSAELVKRIEELWQHNTHQRDMLTILHKEGFSRLSDRELTRIRAKHNWKLRVPNKKLSKSKSSEPKPSSLVPAKRGHDEDHFAESAYGQLVLASRSSPPNARPVYTTSPERSAPELSPEALEKRRLHRQRIAAESDERYQKRTRRRRTAPYAGLSPDPPGPPRFPSETLLAEAKEYLRLGTKTYRAVRNTLEEIMKEMGIRKKTDSGEKWAEAKNQLIGAYAELQALFSQPAEVEASDNAQVDQDKCWLGLEIIANDVAKKIRSQDRRLSIADAKNILGINPAQAAELKTVFHEILKRNHFYSKHIEGKETWDKMKEEWIASSELLQSILASPATVSNNAAGAGGGQDDSSDRHALKLKATEFLARDVMKRLRDSQTKAVKDGNDEAPASANAQTQEPFPTPVTSAPTSATAPRLSKHKISSLASRALASAAAAAAAAEAEAVTGTKMRPKVQTKATARRGGEERVADADADIQIDPSLLGVSASTPLPLTAADREQE